MNDPLIEKLLEEPSLRYKVNIDLLKNPHIGRVASQSADDVKNSMLVTTMLNYCIAAGDEVHPYKKWVGAHWVLSLLADLGYPPGDDRLIHLMNRSYQWLFGEDHARHIRMINGRVRRCASQESNAVYYSLKLGLADARTDQLAERLIKWQWPDGGWNCDKNPDATNSSFMESLLPLRALSLYARESGSDTALHSAEWAAEIFLKRKMFLRQSDGQLMDKEFIRLHYPCYWHYDILFGLKVMAEAGFIMDPACQNALDLLETYRLRDGGFPSHAVFYRCSKPEISGFSPVSWGGIQTKSLNPFVTVDALLVLQAAGRTRFFL